MAQFYYLISSLPMLDLDELPSIDSSGFLDMCRDSVSHEEIQSLLKLSLVPDDDIESAGEIAEWHCWETVLRNGLVRQRGKAVIEDTYKYLREDKDYYAEIEKGIQEAFAKSNPRDREDHLDRVRWAKLDDMEVGHDFDFRKLCIYKLKLMLCEKHVDRNKDKGRENFDETVDAVYGNNPLEPPQIEQNAGK